MKHKLLALLTCIMTATYSQAEQKTDVFTTKNGKEVKITNIKHASIRIQYDGMEIQVDPVANAVKPATDYTVFPKANIILITHEHRDHFDREAIAQLRSPATTVYTNHAVYNMWNNGLPLANGDSMVYRSDIKVEAVPAYNTTPGREQYHPKGRDNGYILTLDGLRIYIAGDTEDIPEMQQIKDIDVAFLPCNQPFTMTIDQLVSAAKTIKPKVLYPYHYSETPVTQIVMKLYGSNTKVRIRDYK